MTHTPSVNNRAPALEIQSAEAQIATVDEQLNEMQAEITNAEVQIEAMEDEIRKRKRLVASTQRKMEKLVSRRDVFIDAVAALRKLDRR